MRVSFDLTEADYNDKIRRVFLKNIYEVEKK